VEVDRRLQEHQNGLASKYTRGRTPVELVYVEELPTKSAALQRERELKRLTRANKQKVIESARQSQ